MRKIVLGAALSSALLVAPAMAQDSSFFVGGELGALISSETDQQYTPGATAGSTGSISSEHDLGYTGSAFFGYDFGALRVELEAGYQSAGIDEVKSSFATPGGLVSGTQPAEGDVSVRAIMANGMWDFSGAEGFTFFVGGGAGGAQLKVSGLTTATDVELLDDKSGSWLFAWQGIAGVRKSLTDNLDAHLRYRYFNVDEAEMIGLGGRVVEADFSSHTLALGLTLNF